MSEAGVGLPLGGPDTGRPRLMESPRPVVQPPDARLVRLVDGRLVNCFSVLVLPLSDGGVGLGSRAADQG